MSDDGRDQMEMTVGRADYGTTVMRTAVVGDRIYALQYHRMSAELMKKLGQSGPLLDEGRPFLDSLRFAAPTH
jgi:hypothetical protein